MTDTDEQYGVYNWLLDILDIVFVEWQNRFLTWKKMFIMDTKLVYDMVWLDFLLCLLFVNLNYFFFNSHTKEETVIK